VGSWSFLTNHARVLLCIARDPGVRLRDIAASVGITERSAYGIVTDLTAAGYVVKEKDGRRNRYQIQPHMPLPEPASQRPAIGEVLDVLAGAGKAPRPPDPGDQIAGQQHHGAGEAQLTAPGFTAT
jgi:MarR family